MDIYFFCQRILNRFWLKSIGIPSFVWIFFEIYFYLINNSFYPVKIIPLTFVDEIIPMQKWAWLPYLSLWLYVSIPPSILTQSRSLLYYGFWIIILCGSGICFYCFYPSALPPINRPISEQLLWIAKIDAEKNVFPSMHVATAVFSGFWLNRLIIDCNCKSFWKYLNVIWCGLIIFSTLATKQHVFWDALSGLFLGIVIAYLSLRLWQNVIHQFKNLWL